MGLTLQYDSCLGLQDFLCIVWYCYNSQYPQWDYLSGQEYGIPLSIENYDLFLPLQLLWYVGTLLPEAGISGRDK